MLQQLQDTSYFTVVALLSLLNGLLRYPVAQDIPADRQTLSSPNLSSVSDHVLACSHHRQRFNNRSWIEVLQLQGKELYHSMIACLSCTKPQCMATYDHC